MGGRPRRLGGGTRCCGRPEDEWPPGGWCSEGGEAGVRRARGAGGRGVRRAGEARLGARRRGGGA